MKFDRTQPARSALLTAVACAALVAQMGQSSAAQTSSTADLSTSDVHLRFEAGESSPSVVLLEGGRMAAVRNLQSEAMPTSVEVDGKTIPISWKLKPELCKTDAQHVTFAYESEEPHLLLQWTWQARAGFGPLEHSIRVENLGGREVWLPMIDSLRLQIPASADRQMHNFYVEKGAGTPSPVGVHLDKLDDGYAWTGESSTYAHPGKGEPREIIPAAFVYFDEGSQDGWLAGIEFSGRTRVHVERHGADIDEVLGLNPEPGPFKTRIDSGEVFETPTVFLGVFSGGPDGAANELRPWVRAVLGNPLTWKDPHYPLLVNNSWGGGMQIDEKLALQMIHDSKELGLEMFHVDAGWFRGVGDWYPDPKKFPHGLAYVADAAHREGLRFGIWVDWSQAAFDTEPGALNVNDPKVRDWMVSDLPPGWKPEEFKGQTVDIGVPAAHDYFRREIRRMVDSYHLDMIEHDGYVVPSGCTRDDHPHAPPIQSTMKVTPSGSSVYVMASNSTDVSYHAVRAYYDIYSHTRQEHPGLLFEICNDGGRMVDFGTAAHGDYFSITDTYDPLSNRRAFYDTSYMLPAAMLESYVEKWPTPQPENFLYMLRSGMMGWLTIMMDTNAWTPAQHEAARQAFALYKEKLRPLIRDARLYHVSPRPNGVSWDGVEYWDPTRGDGVVFAFRGSVPDETQHRYRLFGLDETKTYQLHFQDGSAPDRRATGRELMQDGLLVKRNLPLSSELVFLNEEGR